MGPGQLKQAVKDVKKSGFAPFGKNALVNAKKPVAIPGRKQAKASTETEGGGNGRNGDFEEAAAQTKWVPRHRSTATRAPGAIMGSVSDGNSNCAAEQHRGRLRPP